MYIPKLKCNVYGKLMDMDEYLAAYQKMLRLSTSKNGSEQYHGRLQIHNHENLPEVFVSVWENSIERQELLKEARNTHVVVEDLSIGEQTLTLAAVVLGLLDLAFGVALLYEYLT